MPTLKEKFEQIDREPLRASETMMVLQDYLDIIDLDPAVQAEIKQKLIDKFGYLPQAVLVNGGGVRPMPELDWEP